MYKEPVNLTQNKRRIEYAFEKCKNLAVERHNGICNCNSCVKPISQEEQKEIFFRALEGEFDVDIF